MNVNFFYLASHWNRKKLRIILLVSFILILFFNIKLQNKSYYNNKIITTVSNNSFDALAMATANQSLSFKNKGLILYKLHEIQNSHLDIHYNSSEILLTEKIEPVYKRLDLRHITNILKIPFQLNKPKFQFNTIQKITVKDKVDVAIMTNFFILFNMDFTLNNTDLIFNFNKANYQCYRGLVVSNICFSKLDTHHSLLQKKKAYFFRNTIYLN
jgi:hypothetical protein